MTTTAVPSTALEMLEQEESTLRFETSVSHPADHQPGALELWHTSLVVDPETGRPEDCLTVASASAYRVTAYLPDEIDDVWEQFDEESGELETVAAALPPHLDSILEALGFGAGVIYLDRVEVAEELRGRQLGQLVTARLLATLASSGSDSWVVCAIAGYRSKDGKNPAEEAAIASLLRSLSLDEIDSDVHLWAAESCTAEFEDVVGAICERDAYEAIS